MASNQEYDAAGLNAPNVAGWGSYDSGVGAGLENWPYHHDDGPSPRADSVEDMYAKFNITNWETARVDESGLDINFMQSGCPNRCKVCVPDASSPEDWTQARCIVCLPNSTWDESSGLCVCNEGWIGRDCSFYNGVCSPFCKGCYGPTPHQCVQCNYGTGRNESGACVCPPPTTPYYMAAYPCIAQEQACADACINCVRRSEEYVCDMCVENAGRTKYGRCECLPHWRGQACDTYAGPCEPPCLTCVAPDQCLSCKPHATLTADMCVCESDWDTLSDCSLYSGVCDPKCDLCTGPTDSDCIMCTSNAKLVGG